MRYFTSSLAVVAITLALVACTGKSSSSDQSNASATTGSEATAAASSDAGAMGAQTNAGPSASASSGPIPDYPGATVSSQTNPSSMAQTNASGRVLATADSFDKVYAWYQAKMPSGSERVHLTQPSPTALFVTYDANKNQDSVQIAERQGKTIITIGHVVSRTK